MNRIIIFIFTFILLISCAAKVKYITIPLTDPPTRYEPYIIENNKDALLEYQEAGKKIIRWQNWYNTQVGSNYYNYTNYELKRRTNNTNNLIN